MCCIYPASLNSDLLISLPFDSQKASSMPAY